MVINLLNKVIKAFLNLKIGIKIFISFTLLIVVTALIIGIKSYTISSDALTGETIDSSDALLQQLSINLEYSITAIEDFVFSQYYNSKINQYISISNTGTVADYNKKSSINSFAFNLLNMKDYIKVVAIRDTNGKVYFFKKDGAALDISEYEQLVKPDTVKAGWGKTTWMRYDKQLILVNRAMFSSNTTSYMGIISLGIDNKYFETLYKGISDKEGSSIMLLDGRNDVLIADHEEDMEIVKVLKEKNLMGGDRGNLLTYNNNQYMYNVLGTSNSGIKILHILDMGIILKGSAQVTRIIIFTAIIVILFAIIFAWFISSNISQNIRLLLKNIETMSKGDFTRTIEPVSYDEIGMLACEFNTMGRKINQLIETVYIEKMKIKNAELKALQFEYDSLQSKMNPHFLYNTLETINSMAKLRNEHEIGEMVCLLGNLLRSSISSKKNIIRLQEEIDYISGYLKIQSLSYGNMIQVEYNFDECLMDALVPKLILQPIVENAIIHGFEKKRGNSRISISSLCKDKLMVLKVVDDGMGIDNEILKNILNGSEGYTQENNNGHTKVGINSVDKRIKILYGEEYGVKIHSIEGKGTDVTITFPLKFEDEEGNMDELQSNVN